MRQRDAADIEAVCLFKWSGVRGDTHGHRYITLHYVSVSLEKELFFLEYGESEIQYLYVSCFVTRMMDKL